MKESAVLFGKSNSLVGVISQSPQSNETKNLPGVIILNSGLVHHVGLSRLHVRMARSMAELGFVVFRFDFSGHGDSRNRRDHLPFEESSVAETQDAMDLIGKEKGIEEFVLMGICSGAMVSFNTALRDRRVTGAALINVRDHLHKHSDEANAYFDKRTLIHHYYRMFFLSTFRMNIWKKVLTGNFDFGAVLGLLANVRLAKLFPGKKRESFEQEHENNDMKSLAERGVRLLMINSEADEGLDYLHVVLGRDFRDLNTYNGVTFEIIHGANHTFTMRWSQDYLLHRVQRWVTGIGTTMNLFADKNNRISGPTQHSRSSRLVNRGT